jgi:lipoprotein-releasing system permease protein
MRFERLMAMRYLRGAQGRSEGQGFLRFIMYVAVGGVTVGVAALLISLSIVRGFSREIEAKIIGFGSHVQVESYQGTPLENAASLRRRIEGFEEVQAVAPVVQDFILLRRSAQEIDGVMLWGADSLPSFLQESLIAGSGTFSPDTAAHPILIVGEELAQLLGLSVGDVTTAFSVRPQPQGDAEDAGLLSRRPRVAQFTVGGIYETSLLDFDELYVFASIHEARDLLEYEADEVSRFDVTLYSLEQAEPVARQIESELGFPVMARAVFEVWQGLFAWVNLQKNVIPMVIAVLTIVAAFNILSTLLMVIMEKVREIGILESMGASPKSLRRLFLWLGLLIGIVGTTLGAIIAVVLALLQQRFKIIPLPEEAYYMKWAPIELNPFDFIVVIILAVVLCSLASYIPARVAAKIDPIRVIRFR